MNMKPLARFSLTFFLASLIGCGGGGSSAPKIATALTYTAPSGAAGWQLVRNGAQSTATHLVLDLVGPAAESGFGATLELTVQEAQLAWARVQPGDPEFVQNLRYNLGQGKPILKGVAQGNLLKVAIFHKGLKGTPTSYTGPLASVAVDLKSGLQAGTDLRIGVQLAQELRSTGMKPISLAIGTIQAQ